MTVIARDQVAADHLVYAWPFPIGPECEVSCLDDEQVVMCPAWMVGDRLGPGRHRWRTPDPTRPVTAFFVLTAPVEVSFDLVTSFVIPSTGQGVRLRASGSVQVRCGDPGLLIAQFVGLPFDNVNEGILRSVSRSIERMLARLLTRRVVMGASPIAVTDPGMLPGIVEELIAYNPTAGAVFGVDLIRIGRLVVVADDGTTPYLALPPAQNLDWSGSVPHLSPEVAAAYANGNHGNNGHAEAPTPPRQHERPKTPKLETTMRGMAAVAPEEPPPTRARAGSVPPADPEPAERFAAASGEIVRRDAPPPAQAAVSGEIGGNTSGPPTTASGEISSRTPAKLPSVASGEINPRAKTPTVPGMPQVTPIPPPIPRRAQPVEVPRSPDDITQPSVEQRTLTPVPGSVRLAAPSPPPIPKPPAPAAPAPAAPAPVAPAPSSILGIGVAPIGSGSGSSAVAGEIPSKVNPGARVLVPGPNGLMQSATVRQLLQGYYELEVGSSGETIWVPYNGVVPE